MNTPISADERFLDLRGKPVYLVFLAMEYYAVIMNRTFVVVVTKKTICGAKIAGVTAGPRSYGTQDERYNLADPESPEFLAINSSNFQMPCSSVTKVVFSSKKKASMGGIPHSGSLFITTEDNKKREFILLGDQEGQEIEARLRAICPKASA